MSAKSITFNSFSLQDDNFRTRDIIYRNLPSKTIDLESIARRDGFRYVNSYYTDKRISIVGTVTRDTIANLKISVDAMKEALNVDESNLDIDDNGTTVRWVASVERLDVPEEFYHITRIPYEIVFLCQPLGKATTTTNDSKTITEASAAPYLNTFDPTGSAPPLPVIKYTADGIPTTAITQIKFENTTTTESITVSSLAIDASGDYLEIDIENMTVKVSHDGGAAAEVDFSGVFPTFKATSNSYSVTITGGGATWTLEQDIDYYVSTL